MQKLLITLLMAIVLAGCAEPNPPKAPCNASGSNCYPRTSINQWDAGEN